MVPSMAKDRRRRSIWPEPEWLFLLAGVALLSATVLLPAARDLAELRWQRDVALAVERQQRERVFRYERYALALAARDPQVVRALAAAQLNRMPDGRVPLLLASNDAAASPALDPPPIRMRARPAPASRLEHWATDRRSRLWLIAAGGACVLLGVLPRAALARRPIPGA